MRCDCQLLLCPHLWLLDDGCDDLRVAIQAQHRAADGVSDGCTVLRAQRAIWHCQGVATDGAGNFQQPRVVVQLHLATRLSKKDGPVCLGAQQAAAALKDICTKPGMSLVTHCAGFDGYSSDVAVVLLNTCRDVPSDGTRA